MFQTAFYLGKEKETGYSGVIAEGGLFIAFEAGEGMTGNRGRDFLKMVKDKIMEVRPVNLSGLEDIVSDTIRKENPPAGFSMSLSYIKGKVIYLKTQGTGKVIIKRQDKVATLLTGDNGASGYFENNDIYVFTTDRFIDLIGGDLELKSIFDHKNPSQIVEEMTPILKGRKDQGAVALFLQILEATVGGEGELVVENEVERTRPVEEENFFYTLKGRLEDYYLRFGKKKTLTFLTVLIIFIIFVWSVVLGVKRRTNKQATLKIAAAKELVGQKLSSARDVAYLNMPRAEELIRESKQIVGDLDKKYPNRKDLEEIRSMVNETENKILKKEEKSYSEFFDLGVEAKGAKGSKFYLDQDNLLILDKEAGTMHKLSLEKKSIESVKASPLREASLIGIYEDKRFFYSPSVGVYQVDDSGKVKQIIKGDKEWGDIADMSLFNGNIYLLDNGKSDVYKFVPTDNGFGGGKSYFEADQKTDLSWSESLAIDASVYIGGGNTVIKFTSGLRDGFSMTLPNDKVAIAKIITNQDLNAIYLWDKKASMIYVVGKSGEFSRQISSSILGKATDLVVYKDQIYALDGSKIYKID